MRKLLVLVLLGSKLAWAASPGSVFLQFDRNSSPTNVHEDTVTPANSIGLPVSIVGGLTIGSVNQGNQGAQASPWWVEGTDGTNHASYTAASEEKVNSSQLPATLGQKLMAASVSCALASDQSAIPVTGTFWQATQPVSAVSLPLPTGAATSALQSQISAQLPATLGQKTMVNSLAVTLASDQSAVPVSGTFWQATQPVSAASLPLPTGAATSALQTTGNSSLSAISGQLPAVLDGSGFLKVHEQGTASVAVTSLPATAAKTSPNSTAAFSQTSVTTTASTISAPANAVRVLIQGDSANTDCIRYRFDGTAATATVGIVAQAGQDSGQLDSGMSVSVAACSGTQKVNVQYLAQ